MPLREDAPPPDDTPQTRPAAGAEPPTLPPGATFVTGPTPGAPPGAAPPQPTAPPGFEFEKELGRGGMGIVYKARQVKLDRVVALKVLRSGEFALEDEVRRFLIEAQAVAKLKHPGIVQVFEFGQHAGLPFYTMEYIEGGSLHDRVAGGPLPPREAAQVVVAIANAIQHAHEKKILHRDLKPENVMMTCDNLPRVTDFGLARIGKKSGTERTPTGAMMGTPGYAAPEQLGGSGEVGPASDLYSIGSILYRVLVGRPPFQAASILDTIRQVLEDDPVPPRRLNPAVPADLETITLKCLRKEPGKRYPSARALAEDLCRWLAHEPIHARPVGVIERGVKWVRRNTAVAVLLGMVALTVISGITASTLFAFDADARARSEKTAHEEADEAKRQADADRQTAELARDRAEALLYASQLAAARREWQAGNAETAWQHLDATRWDLRGWEYYHLHGLFTEDYVRLGEHAGQVTAVAVSPDGAFIASAGDDQTVQIREAQSGQLVHTLAGPRSRVNSLAYSPDGRLLVLGVVDYVIEVWDARTARPLFQLAGHRDAVASLAFSPDGRLLASASRDGTVRLWAPYTGQLRVTLTPGTEALHAVAFSPDGRRLVAGGDGRALTVWDVATRQSLYSIGPLSAPVTCLAYAPDGTQLAAGGEDGIVRAWDARTTQALPSRERHTKKVTALVYRPDGQRLISASEDRQVILWDGATSRLLRTIHGHVGSVLALACTPDARRIVSAGQDRGVFVWQGRREPTPAPPMSHDAIAAARYSLDGKWLATAGRDPQLLLHPTTGGPLRPMRRPNADDKNLSPITCLDFDPASERVVCGNEDRALTMWNIGDASLRDIWPNAHGDPVSGVAFSPDGKYIVSSSRDQTLKLWKADSVARPVRTFTGHTAAVTGVAFDPTGKHIASSSDDDTIRLWEVEGDTVRVLRGHGGFVNAVAFSPDGQRLASSSHDGTVRIWEVATGKELAALKGHAAPVLALAFFPDGQRLVSSSHDQTLRVWAVRTGIELLTLPSARNVHINAVAVDRTGRQIVGVGTDGIVWRWSTEAEPASRPLRGPLQATILRATLREGQVIGELEEGGTLVWDARTGQLLGRTRDLFPEGEEQRELPDGSVLEVRNNELHVVAPHREVGAILRRRHRLRAWNDPNEEWRGRQLSESRGFGLVWHLNQARADAKSREKLLSAKANDPAALIALARQASCDPRCKVDRRRLLGVLAALADETKEPAAYRALAGLQLRAGAAEAALASLHVVRAEGAASVEDLLVQALIHHRLGRREEARRDLALARLRANAPAASALHVAGQVGAATSPLAALMAILTPDDHGPRVQDGYAATERELLLAEASRLLDVP